MSDSWDPMDCSLPSSFVLGIFQATILEWVAVSFSRELIITINQRNVSSLWKFYRTHSHNLHFETTGLARRFSGRRNCPQAGYIVVIWSLSSVHCSSVAQSCPTLWPHGLQHARPPCPSPSPRACSDSWPSSRWCHPTVSSSVYSFSSCPQSFPASGSLQMSQLFESGGQSIGVSASTSVLP